MRNHDHSAELKSFFRSLRGGRQPGGPTRVLVAVDDSDPGKWAVTVGERLANAIQGEVVLLHVINPTVVASPEQAMTFEIDRIRASQRRSADRLLEAARERISPALQVEQVVLEGNAGEAIVEAAREWRVALVVMGTRGRGRLASFLLGSTADEVVRRAHCPVVTVGHDPSPDDGACPNRDTEWRHDCSLAPGQD
jgi:nucleotide-binding universal stress UspA family protein